MAKDNRARKITTNSAKVKPGDIIVGYTKHGPVTNVSIDGIFVCITFEDGHEHRTSKQFKMSVFRGYMPTTKTMSFNSKTGVLMAEISRLQHEGYSPAHIVFLVKSHLTGAIIKFELKRVEHSNDGKSIKRWTYKPMPRVNGISELVIVND